MNVRRHIRRAAPLGAARTNWYDSPWRIAGRAVSSALILAVIVLLLALIAVPRLLGGDALTVLSGSMEPTFAPGDVAVVKGIDESAVCSDVSVGTIVTFFPEPNDPTLITHRVVGKTIGSFDDGTSCRLLTQGDANSAVDAPVSPAQLRGVFMYGVPKLGWIRQWASENTMLVVGAVAAVVIVAGVLGSFRKPRTTIVRVPAGGSAGPGGTSGSGAPGLGTGGPGAGSILVGSRAADATDAGRSHDLVERELELRARELDLRERELAYAMQRTPEASGETATRPAVPEPGAAATATLPAVDLGILDPLAFLAPASNTRPLDVLADTRIEA